jgi:hypothetical protein
MFRQGIVGEWRKLHDVVLLRIVKWWTVYLMWCGLRMRGTRYVHSVSVRSII